MEYLSLRDRLEFALTCKKHYNDHFMRISKFRKFDDEKLESVYEMLVGYETELKIVICECGAKECGKCSIFIQCEDCDRFLCKKHTLECEDCGSNLCSQCTVACDICNSIKCSVCSEGGGMVKCYVCKKQVCEDCVVYIEGHSIVELFKRTRCKDCVKKE